MIVLNKWWWSDGVNQIELILLYCFLTSSPCAWCACNNESVICSISVVLHLLCSTEFYKPAHCMLSCRVRAAAGGGQGGILTDRVMLWLSGSGKAVPSVPSVPTVPLPTDNVNIQCSCGVGGQLARAIHGAHSLEAVTVTVHSCRILLRWLGSNIKQGKH